MAMPEISGLCRSDGPAVAAWPFWIYSPFGVVLLLVRLALLASFAGLSIVLPEGWRRREFPMLRPSHGHRRQAQPAEVGNRSSHRQAHRRRQSCFRARHARHAGYRAADFPERDGAPAGKLPERPHLQACRVDLRRASDLGAGQAWAGRSVSQLETSFRRGQLLCSGRNDHQQRQGAVPLPFDLAGSRPSGGAAGAEADDQPGAGRPHRSCRAAWRRFPVC